MAVEAASAVLSHLPEQKRVALYRFLNASSRSDSDQDDVECAIYASLTIKAALKGKIY